MSIDKVQIKLIHVLKARIGMTDEEYRAMLVGYKAESSTELTKFQAQQLITSLEQLARKAGVWKRTSRADGAPSRRPRWMASQDQLAKIEALWSRVSFQDTPEARQRALQNFIYHRWKYGGLEMIPKNAVPRIVFAIECMIKQKIQEEQP